MTLLPPKPSSEFRGGGLQAREVQPPCAPGHVLCLLWYRCSFPGSSRWPSGQQDRSDGIGFQLPALPCCIATTASLIRMLTIATASKMYPSKCLQKVDHTDLFWSVHQCLQTRNAVQKPGLCRYWACSLEPAFLVKAVGNIHCRTQKHTVMEGFLCCRSAQPEQCSSTGTEQPLLWFSGPRAGVYPFPKPDSILF